MSIIRNGKIARLPGGIREQVNQRLADHESSTPLLAWLNALPEVQTVLVKEFGGKAIVRQNLSEWRKGGYAEWQRQQQAGRVLERLCAGGHVLSDMGSGAVMDTMAGFLAAKYVVSLRQGGNDGQAAGWSQLRECCHDLVALRRREHLAQRLEFDKAQAKAVLDMNGKGETFNV